MRARHRRVVLFSLLGWIVGCNDSRPSPPPAIKRIGPLSVSRANAPSRVISAEDEIPATSYAFEGAKGNVRVSMEVEGSSGSDLAVPISLNDVLFKAIDDGRLSVGFKRPWPEHPNGRVTIHCVSGLEDSSAEFEPELWFRMPGAIVTFESPLGEPSNPIVEGKEVVLGRYVARNTPREVRLTFKAIFTKDPVTPRTNAGPKSAH